MKERRRFPRLPITIEVGAKQGDMSIIRAESFDISLGGIRLLSAEELPKGAVMDLEINLPIPLIVARGQVAWTKEAHTKEGRLFQAGIRLSGGFISANCAKMKGFVHNIMQAAKA